MNTIRLFDENVYKKTCESRVISVIKNDGKTSIVLDQTVFFPEGGGQSSDMGNINNSHVCHVYEEDGLIYHVFDSLGDDFKEGDMVNCEIDWPHRFDNMQRHSGEHVLTGIFYREYGGINRGFHMGDSYMTIDISLEEDPEYKEITWDMLKRAEYLANEVIWQNLPVVREHFDTFDEANKVPMRKKLAIEKDITLVGIGDLNNRWGTVACCGTHPHTTGEIGMIKAYKIESNKGMFRIYFEAGKRAFEKYQHEFDTMTELSNKLSSGTDDLVSKYLAQQEKNNSVRNQLHFLKKEVIRREVAEIKNELLSDNTTPYVRKYQLLSVDDLLAISRELENDIPKIIFLVSEPTNTIILASSGKVDCGKLVKENASIYNGKGGGNNKSARAIFDKYEYVDTFIDLIDKHLR